MTCEEQVELGIDYEIGYTFKEKVIPKAVLYYMGDIFDDDEDDDEENEISSDLEYEDSADEKNSASRFVNKNKN